MMRPPGTLGEKKGGRPGRPPSSSSELLAGEVDVRVVPALRPQEVAHRIAVVAPGEVLVAAVADVGDVVTHIGKGNDRVELGQRVDPRERLAVDAAGRP